MAPRLPLPRFRLTKAEPAPAPDRETTASLTDRLAAASQQRLGRSLALFHVDTGSCNGCELEIRALHSVVYDLRRFGLRFVASPNQADVLLVTGPLTRTMRTALERAWDATPGPKWVVAVGDCAVDGGVFRESPAVLGGPGAVVPVDLTVSGCPPSPARLLSGLRALLEANAG